MKKIISLILAAACMLTLSVPAFAAETTVSNDAENKLTLPITGNVQAVTISATLTLSSAFVINPNVPDDQQFVAPELTVTNTGYAPIDFEAVSLTAQGDSPKVVDYAIHNDTEWRNLPVKDTLSEIGLGVMFQVDGIDEIGHFFFGNEGEQTPTKLFSIDPGAEKSMTLCSRYGRSWPEAKELNYEMVSKIYLKQS